jgi:hypothetical protein
MIVRSLLIASTVIAWTMAASTQQASLSGNWALNFTGPQGPIEASAKFSQDGENVTGTISGPQGDVECSGTIKSSKLALSMTVNAGGQTITVYLLGDVEGESIKGTWSFGDGSNEWSGKKKG